MPQDVTFDLPFVTPVSERPEFTRARRPHRIRDMDLARGKAGSEEYESPEGSRPGMPRPVSSRPSRLPGAAANLGSGGRATPDGPRVLSDQHS